PDAACLGDVRRLHADPVHIVLTSGSPSIGEAHTPGPFLASRFNGGEAEMSISVSDQRPSIGSPRRGRPTPGAGTGRPPVVGYRSRSVQ
ncbi:MAG: hypothetical protein ACREQ5_34455, partial [Candidatus Dormibacteria bacterium]